MGGGTVADIELGCAGPTRETRGMIEGLLDTERRQKCHGGRPKGGTRGRWGRRSSEVPTHRLI